MDLVTLSDDAAQCLRCIGFSMTILLKLAPSQVQNLPATNLELIAIVLNVCPEWHFQFSFHSIRFGVVLLVLKSKTIIFSMNIQKHLSHARHFSKFNSKIWDSLPKGDFRLIAIIHFAALLLLQSQYLIISLNSWHKPFQ